MSGLTTASPKSDYIRALLRVSAFSRRVSAPRPARIGEIARRRCDFLPGYVADVVDDVQERRGGILPSGRH
jgi:hypothetical protein